MTVRPLSELVCLSLADQTVATLGAMLIGLVMGALVMALAARSLGTTDLDRSGRAP